VKFLDFGGRNSHFSFLKLRKTCLSPNEVNQDYMEVLSLYCGKYAKELTIGANDVSCISEDEIQIFRS
jgi:hypothetical protein